MASVHVSGSEKKTKDEGGVLLFEDEASFRQDSTLYQTWARIGHQPLIPRTGQRKNVKVFGAVNLFEAKFHFRDKEEVFNAKTYMGFLEQLEREYYPRKTKLIQDNASYHKETGIWDWFKANRKWLEVYQLPPYSPQFNAVERVWHHVRITGTHNRYFLSRDELLNTLELVLTGIQKDSTQIRGYLAPFC